MTDTPANFRKIEYLQLYQDALLEQDRLADEIEVQHVRAQKVTARLTGMPRGTTKADNVRAIEKIIEAECAYNAYQDRLEQVKHDVEAYLRLCPDRFDRLILTYRFINGRGWAYIAKACHCDKRTATRHYKRGLNALPCPTMPHNAPI